MRHWLFIFSENSQVMADLHIHASTLSVRTQISISLKVSQETTVSSRPWIDDYFYIILCFT